MKRCFIVLISMVLLIIGLTACGNENIEDKFCQYDDTTLVKVHYDDGSILSLNAAIGFVSNDKIEAFFNGNLEGNIKVLHPFKEGQFVIASADSISDITTITYEYCYQNYYY